MNEYFRIFLVFVLYASCFFVALASFRLTGLSQAEQSVSTLYNIVLIIVGLLGVLLVCYKSEEPFCDTLIKLVAQSTQWFMIMLCLVSINFLIKGKPLALWATVAVLSGGLVFGLEKLKNCKWVNNA
ncbi:MAG: hypothetical protein ABJD02_12415 [Paraglaciecola sp.]|uniref:hypothetical protein n=1 Tax=Paraglaciecola sp. TaxID=1920173 RepID=UPI0032665729